MRMLQDLLWSLKETACLKFLSTCFNGFRSF